MTTPLILVSLLALPVAVMTLIERLSSLRFAPSWKGRIGLALVFLFTGVAHFVRAEAMLLMLPPWVPAPVELVYLSGVFELCLAIGILSGAGTLWGWSALAFLVVVFPLNVYGAVNRVAVGGHAWGPVYLLVRAPLQVLLMYWTWRFAITPARN